MRPRSTGLLQQGHANGPSDCRVLTPAALAPLTPVHPVAFDIGKSQRQAKKQELPPFMWPEFFICHLEVRTVFSMLPSFRNQPVHVGQGWHWRSKSRLAAGGRAFPVPSGSTFRGIEKMDRCGPGCERELPSWNITGNCTYVLYVDVVGGPLSQRSSAGT